MEKLDKIIPKKYQRREKEVKKLKIIAEGINK